MNRAKPKIGLALGSGGARGWCHIGILRALADMGIRPDVVSGASMGALVGAFHAGGALDALEDWALGLTARRFFALLDVRLSSGGLVGGAEIRRVVERFVPERRIEALDVPLALVATDMGTGREVWFTEGDLADAVRASVALPGVISPHRIGDRWHLDGGLTNPLPVSACRLLGAEVVIAANPDGRYDGSFWETRKDEFPHLRASWRDLAADLPAPLASVLSPGAEVAPHPQYLDVLSASIDIMTDGIRRSKLAGDPPHVLLDAELPDISVLEFHRAAEAIDEGRRAVERNAEALARAARL